MSGVNASVAQRSGRMAELARQKSLATLAAAYREGLALTAILAVGDPTDIQIMTCGSGADPSLKAGETVRERWWCRHVAQADYVAAAAARAIARARRKTIDSAAQAITGAADRLSIPLQSDAEITGEAMRAIERLEHEIDMQKRAGALKSVNASYRAYRLEASARGEPAQRYAEWMDCYKANLLREIAAKLR